jgi:transcriptional regulator with XRE-family HTH domain
MTLGDYMRHVRVAHLLSGQWVAEHIGIDPRELNEYEHDRALPPRDVLERLERCYLMHPGQLTEYPASSHLDDRPERKIGSLRRVEGAGGEERTL